MRIYQILEWLFPVFEGALMAIIAMALHELGHLVTALALGIRVKSVGFCWKGAYVVREPGPPLKGLMVSLAGPLTNAALLLFWDRSRIFGIANLCFAIVNLLPIQGSDGDRIMNICQEISKESSRAHAM